MENNLIKQNPEEVMEKVKNSDFSVYFFTLDTKGKALASISYIYETVKALNDNGIKAVILHEKKDYHGVADWMGAEYMELPHQDIESQSIMIGTQDFLVIPEIFTNIMKDTMKLSCKKIILSQSYDYILEMMDVQDLRKWHEYGISEVITTSNKQRDYINSLFGGGMNIQVVNPHIPEYFKHSDNPKKPIVAIHTRDQRDAINIVKEFYLKYPIYRWVTLRDMRGLPRDYFANFLSECCLSVWIDDMASFGTFPIESMKCGTPIIAKIPEVVPEWMEKENDENQIMLAETGIWTNSKHKIPDLIATYIKLWFEDNIPQELYDNMTEFDDKFTSEKFENDMVNTFKSIVSNRIAELQVMITKEEKEVVNAE